MNKKTNAVNMYAHKKFYDKVEFIRKQYAIQGLKMSHKQITGMWAEKISIPKISNLLNFNKFKLIKKRR